jgi:acetyltransferase-like isoleucine patch superfamily enzyme
MELKQVMIKYPLVMNLISYIYNLIHYNNIWRYRRNNTFIIKGAFLKNVHLHISGKGNTLIIGPKARLNNCEITFIGNQCKLLIGGGSTIVSNVSLWCQDNDSCIMIGNDFMMNGGHIASCEGTSIKIGNDCMFSNDIEIRSSDSHSIINLKGERINRAKNIIIGNHVWLTAHVRVLKGSIIPSNCIIGNSSLVSSKLNDENAIYAGIPCKTVKDKVNWNKYKI